MLGYEGPNLGADKKELIWAAESEYVQKIRSRDLYNWDKTRRAWYFQARAARPDAPVFLTKAPPFLILVDQLREAFANARFVFLVRNPYAVVEAITRYKARRFDTREAALTAAAAHILRCLTMQRENIASHADVGTFLSYEDLCADPAAAAAQVQALVPELTNLEFDQRLAVKGRYHERLRNMNAQQIERLTREDIEIINRKFAPLEALLRSFGYGILSR
ncbi:hypothetical protein FIU90_13175 [Erythrobacter sp. THAF29]|nr:hypothetical protein FIU90_13175 [Erythrobacter sp. THAF29]